MSVVWRKVWRDLLGNKVRTTLVVLSISVGVFALGLVFNMRDALNVWMLEDYRSANASHLLIRMTPFQYHTIRLFQREFENTELESQVSLSIQWRWLKNLCFILSPSLTFVILSFQDMA